MPGNSPRSSLPIPQLLRDFLGDMQAGFTTYFKNYVKNAKRDNRDFALTAYELYFLSQLPCHYCGKATQRPTVCHKSTQIPFMSVGLDRVDSTLGYELSNVVPCCWTCNDLKGTLDRVSFLEKVKDIMTNEEIKNKMSNKDIPKPS